MRQNWSALGIDLDAIWRDTIPALPGYAELDHLPAFSDSRPLDLLLLFDQGCCWVNSLHQASLMLQELSAGEGTAAVNRLTPQQIEGIAAVTTRLRSELAAVRMLAIAGLTMPAMQISRSISEDIDLALALLVRRKLAQSFVTCRTAADATEFWRRHVAGERAFRLVAQALYRYGLDYSEDSEYVRWRKEVLVFLGSAVHTSFIGSAATTAADSGASLNAAALECLYFATVRLQEMCAYSLVLGNDLRHDLAALRPDGELARAHLRFVQSGGDIIIDQMRWLTGNAESSLPAGRPKLH